MIFFKQLTLLPTEKFWFADPLLNISCCTFTSPLFQLAEYVFGVVCCTNFYVKILRLLRSETLCIRAYIVGNNLLNKRISLFGFLSMYVLMNTQSLTPYRLKTFLFYMATKFGRFHLNNFPTQHGHQSWLLFV
jgi:hypothetical protein